jgi:DNA (cytosine-5)-methyltransferase 1
MNETGGAAMCKWGGAGARQTLKENLPSKEFNGALNADWVECLMGFDIGYTDIDCPNPQPWPGWPAPLGAKDWATSQAHDSGAGKAERVGRFGTKHGGRNLADEALLPDTGQYPYEPPRVITGQKNRAKRLKALGNAVVPQQIYPIFAAIKAVEEAQNA